MVGSEHQANPAEPWRSLFAEPVFETTLSSGLPVRVLPRGIFLFDFEAWNARLAPSTKVEDERLAIHARCASLLNAHLACLYTAIFNCADERKRLVARHMEVSAFDLIILRRDQPTNPTALFEMSPFASGELFHQLRGAPLVYSVSEITTEGIKESFRLLDHILSIEPHHMIVTLAEITLRARNALEKSDYALSLTLAWAVVERLLNALWDSYLASNRERTIEGKAVTFINAERRERLLSRDYTASVKAEVLSLANILPFSLFEEVTRARKARNAWLHGLEPVERQDAMAAVSSARSLLKLVHNVELRWLFAFHPLRG